MPKKLAPPPGFSPGQPDSSPATSPEPPLCGALVAETLAPCSRAPASGATPYCRPHGKEYRELTRAYKERSAVVEGLKATAWLPPNKRSGFRTVREVELALERAERWRDEIPKEIEGRRTQHMRFFPMKSMSSLSTCSHRHSLSFVLCAALRR